MYRMGCRYSGILCPCKKGACHMALSFASLHTTDFVCHFTVLYSTAFLKRYV